MAPPRLNIPQGTPWPAGEEEWLLGALGNKLYFGGGAAIAHQEARAGRFGRYALEQQAIVDATQQAARQGTGIPGLGPMPQVGGQLPGLTPLQGPGGAPGLSPQPGAGSILPPGFTDPLTGAFKLPDGVRAQLKRTGIDPDLIEGTVQRNLHTRAGADYQQRLLYGQDIATSPNELQAAKEQLFASVAKATAADPANADRVYQAAFSGPNSDQLLAEYDKRRADAAARSDDDSIFSKIKGGVGTSFGQLMSALGGPADVVRESISVVTGAREKTGRPSTAADIGREAGELGKDVVNLLTLGTAGMLDPNARSTTQAPSIAEIARTMRTRGVGDELAMAFIPGVAGVKAADRLLGPKNPVSGAFGFLGDVLTDPTTYLTLGYGGLGKAATAAVGNFAKRAKFLSELGESGLIKRYARTDQDTWLKVFDQMVEKHGDDAAGAAWDAGKVLQVGAESAHAAQGWNGYRVALQGAGLDADQILPRGLFELGGNAKLATNAAQARGGIGLRAGIGVPFTKLQARAYLNVRPGRGISRARNPLGTWFTKQGNQFHQIKGSQVLNGIADVFTFGVKGSDRVWAANNAGLVNATENAAVQGRAIDHRFDTLRQHLRGYRKDLNSWLAEDPDQNPIRFVDVWEKGESSDYWGMVPEEVRKIGDQLWAIHNQGVSYAAGEKVDIPMLREILADDDLIERYFPHKVKQNLGARGGFPVSPTQIGAQRERTLREGARILGPDGTSAMLGEGSYKEVQEVTQKILGAGVLSTDIIGTLDAALGSLQRVTSLTRTYRTLAEAGLLVPDIKNLAPGIERAGADKVRGLWAQPGEKAEMAINEAKEAVAKLGADKAVAERARAHSAAHVAQLDHELSIYGSRDNRADAMIHALQKTRDEKAELLARGRERYAENLAQSEAHFKATKEAMADQVRKGLVSTKEERFALRRQLNELEKARRSVQTEEAAKLKSVEETLSITPAQLKSQLVGDLNRLTSEATSGRWTWTKLQGELRATRDRLAKLEGRELAAARRQGGVMQRAMQAVEAKRGGPLARQRAAATEAASYNDEIAQVEAELKQAGKDGNAALQTTLQTRLTDVMSLRTEALKRAEVANKEAAELWDLMDAGEGAMRFADLREAEVATHAAGAIIDAQTGKMSANLQGQLSKLLRGYAADLVAETENLLASTPKIKFLNKVAREFSLIDSSLPAIPSQGVGRHLADYAGEAARRYSDRGREISSAWADAVGEANAYDEAVAEGKRKMSALLARENDLARQAEAANALDPQAKALATHQREGDDLNFLQSELHREERQLEWWMNNRKEVRETQTLKSLALDAAVKNSVAKQKALQALQNLGDKDPQIALQAAQQLFADMRIFKLMSPEVEHLSAQVGALPYMENGAALPMEIGRMLERVANKGPEAQENLLRVLEMFNRRWKRLTLATPGSVFRRWLGNTYNAIVLAGVRGESFKKAFDAIGLAKEGKSIDKIKDPVLKRYMQLALEYNIFEGQLYSLATDTAPFQTGARHPLQWMQQSLQAYALKGEDIARFAQFIDGLDAGMGPLAARQWTAKYHFFNNELTEKERTFLKPLYPFYAYIRNNMALQFYTLFHQPGKISMYGHAMRDFAAQPEGSTEPSWVTRAGGFPISSDTWLQNTLLDTSPLGLPQTILGIGARGQGTGWLPQDLASGELLSSAPGLTLGLKTGLGINPESGQPLYPQDPGPGTKPITGVLKALGVINDAGKFNARTMAAYQALFPGFGRLGRLSGLLATESQSEQPNYWLGQVLGPNVYTQTDTTAGREYAARKRVVDDMLNSLNARQVPVPTTDELTSRERTELALQRLRQAGVLR